MRRIRALLVIEQCNSEWASVPSVGYKFYKHISELADVTLVTHGRNEEAIRKSHPDANIVCIHETSVTAAWHRVAARLSTIGGNTIWPLYHTLTYPTYAEFNNLVAKQFGQKVLDGEFDVVHAITPMLPRYPYKISRFCEKVPFIIGPVNGGVPYPPGFGHVARSEFSYLNSLRSLGRLLLPEYRNTFLKADHVFSGSLYTKQLLETMFPRMPKVEVMAENGLDDSFFSDGIQQKSSETRNTKKTEILFVGRLVPYKGADIVIDALRMLPADALRRTKLTIVGDGPERAALEAQVRNAELTQVVDFVGWVRQEDTLKFYQSADIFCFPSVREFGGAVALEAMANGLPCIVVDNGGIGEYVTADTGFKINPASRHHVVCEVSKRLTELIESPALRGEMAQAARLRAKAFSWRRKAERIVTVYDLLATKKNAHGSVREQRTF